MVTSYNWYTWQSQIMMAFWSNKSDEIIAGMEEEPLANKADELRDWKRKNQLSVTYMWSHIELEWQHLVLWETSGRVAFMKVDDETQEAIQGFKFQLLYHSPKGILWCHPQHVPTN